MNSNPADPSAWSVDNNPPGKCCGCELHTIQIQASSRFRLIDMDGSGDFGDWSDYSESNLALSAGNSGPGGSEQQMRYLFQTNTPEGTDVGPSFVRYRRVVFFDVGEGESEFTQFVSDSDINVWEIPPEGGSLEYYLPPCSEGQGASLMSGPAGSGIGGMQCKKFAAKLKKQGFIQYDGGGERGEVGELKIYRSEDVTGAAEPGCLATGRPARAYSGGQHHTQILPSEANGYLLDPAGNYVDTRSDDLVEDKHASTRYTLPNETVRFGTAYTPEEDILNMQEDYRCGADSRSKFLQLTLSNYYPTSDMLDAVDSAIETQISILPDDVFNGGIVAGQSGVMHRRLFSTDETIYDLVKCYDFSAATGTADFKTLLNPGASATRTVIVDVSIRSYDDNTISQAQVNLTTQFYGRNDEMLLAPGGRTTRAYDPSLGEAPPPVTHEFYPPSSPELNREIIWSNPRCIGHFLLAQPLPFVESKSAIDEGWEG